VSSRSFTESGRRWPPAARRRATSRRWLGWPLLHVAWLLAGCSSGSPESPEPCIVGASISNPYEIELSYPLRYTTVWTTGGPEPGYWVLGGGPVNTKTGEFQVELRLPSPEVSRKLAPRNDLYLSTQSTALVTVVQAYRPRVVVYEDANGNERLDLEKNGTTDPDRVLSIDDDYYTMGAVLDLEQLLRESAPPLVDLYYEATGGRFTAFVPTMGTGDYTYLGARDFEYRFSLEDAGLALASLRCLRSVTTASTAPSPAVLLDDSLDAALCGLDYGDCRSEKLEKLPAPLVSTVRSSALQRQAICRRREGLEALAVSETRLQCERCKCVTDRELDIFIAAREALPSWWPCGDEVDYCKSASDLAGYPSECLGLAGGAVAGGSDALATSVPPIPGR
jgi:hypothetical protein